ncbi:Uncharacterised protein [Acinetobacter baumannii]|nr:Uncharacterised protein [Acinetobacter baumannii]
MQYRAELNQNRFSESDKLKSRVVLQTVRVKSQKQPEEYKDLQELCRATHLKHGCVERLPWIDEVIGSLRL